MKKKIILVLILVIFLIIYGVYKGFSKKEKSGFTLAKVLKGNVSQEISVTGTVKQGEEINLAFKNSGRIEKILVKVGDSVKTGEVLVRLDTAQLEIQLQESKASLEIAQAKLDKLLAGSSQEEIKSAETDVNNAQISLTTAEENLSQAYGSALNTLDDSYLKIYNSYNTADSIQRTYFTTDDQDGLKVKENKYLIKSTMDRVKPYIDTAKSDSKNDNIDTALSETKKALDVIADSLGIIRGICEDPLYRDRVSSTDKTSLDTRRTDINTARTNITTSQQTISLKELSIDSAEGALQVAKDNLAVVKAKPRQEDIDLYQAQVNQAQSELNLLKAQIEDAILISPTNGEITQINKRIGEIAQPALAESVISLLPNNPFQITVDVYEEDIVKISIGNSVDINLTAFPNEIFKGKVISIDPAEKIKEGVVYYETTIDFENPPEKIKPGMTTDLTITAMTKENVLIIPKAAIEEKDNKTIVQVAKGKNLENREIEIGLKGNNDMVEVISGLKEGEEVAIK